MSKSALFAVVADLYALRYTASEIARCVNRSPDRVEQILQDSGLKRPRLKSIADLPKYMRERCLPFFESSEVPTCTQADTCVSA